jgi:hypothetical protein
MNERDTYKLELVGLGAAGERPNVMVQAVDAADTAFYTQQVGSDGLFSLPADVLKQASRVLLGAADDKGNLRADTAIGFRAAEFTAQIQGSTLALAEGIWSRFHLNWLCVSGRVQACRRRPWWFDSLITAATTVSTAASARAAALVSTTAAALRVPATTALQRSVPSLNDLIVWPYRCAPVCLGSVEVYRRSCCCWPIVFDDPRIDDLIRDLDIYVEGLPKLPRPKPGFPPPPPGDPLKTPFFKGGAFNELAVNAGTDLQMLRSLPKEHVAPYINSRAYLVHRLCTCGAPAKIGSGTIQPDGSFNICWLEPLRLMLVNCYEQYAYVVKQTIGGSTTTIYDGLAAGAWFAAADQPVLTSYNSQAFTCDETGSGDGDAHVFLDLIGDTESHELTTPPSTGWDRVALPDDGSGLLFPNIGPVNSHLRNLGGAIELTFNFSLGMRHPSIDACYYRVSICKADADGNPTGVRYYQHQGLAWQKVVGADIVPESLGPVPPATVGGELNLYRIPYIDEGWVGSVRYHALIDTLSNVPDMNLNTPAATDLASPAAHHLITLEVFNAAGQRLRPLGTAASGQPGIEVEKAFKYRRWFQPGGSVGDDTVEVPHAALTHLFCWDNRPPVADITRLVMNGSASDEECQFLQGPGSSTFAIEYSAYVPDQRFQYSHDIGWLRGLNATAANGGVGTLPTPLSPGNAGKPPAAPVNSGSNTFEHMLTRLDPPHPSTVLPRCSFAVTLTTYAKTTNGEDLSYPQAQESAAFALAID